MPTCFCTAIGGSDSHLSAPMTTFTEFGCMGLHRPTRLHNCDGGKVMNLDTCKGTIAGLGKSLGSLPAKTLASADSPENMVVDLW